MQPRFKKWGCPSFLPVSVSPLASRWRCRD